jgi:L-rhamnose mutarotase
MSISAQRILSSIIVFLIFLSASWQTESTDGRDPRVQRYGSVIGLKAKKLDDYKKLHAHVWPEVAKKISACNIRNYSIYLKKLDDGNYYLFSYFEYTGSDFGADMVSMAADSNTQRWWKLTDPCQTPLAERKQGEWWASMEEVFHQE